MSKEVTIYLMGGLGNVLFQINYAHNLKSHGYDVTLNIYLLENNFVTKKLLGWSTHNTVSVLNDLGLISSFNIINNFSVHLIFGFLSRLFKINIFNSGYYGLISPNYDKLDVNHLFGYFHLDNKINSEFLAIANRAIEKRLCHPDSKCLKENLNYIGNSWVIHIRGGDYRLDPNFAIDIEYYVAATKGKSDFYVVTNDRKYSEIIMSKLNLKFNFVSSNNALDDFIILAMSENKILANSTFSWWAAELGKCNSTIIQKEPFYVHVEWNPCSLLNRQKIECAK